MNNGLVNLGYGNTVAGCEMVAVINSGSLPVQRFIADAEAKRQLIDYTQGRRPRAVVILTTGAVILSAFQPETIRHHESRVRNRL